MLLKELNRLSEKVELHIWKKKEPTNEEREQYCAKAKMLTWDRAVALYGSCEVLDHSQVNDLGMTGIVIFRPTKHKQSNVGA